MLAEVCIDVEPFLDGCYDPRPIVVSDIAHSAWLNKPLRKDVNRATGFFRRQDVVPLPPILP